MAGAYPVWKFHTPNHLSLSVSLSLSVAVTVCQLYTNYTLTLKSPQKTPPSSQIYIPNSSSTLPSSPITLNFCHSRAYFVFIKFRVSPAARS